MMSMNCMNRILFSECRWYKSFRDAIEADHKFLFFKWTKDKKIFFSIFFIPSLWGVLSSRFIFLTNDTPFSFIKLRSRWQWTSCERERDLLLPGCQDENPVQLYYTATNLVFFFCLSSVCWFYLSTSSCPYIHLFAHWFHPFFVWREGGERG